MIKDRMIGSIGMIGQVEREFGGRLHKHYASIRDTYREYLDLESTRQPCDKIFNQIEEVRL
jgi:RecA/RadA recombinase